MNTKPEEQEQDKSLPSNKIGYKVVIEKTWAYGVQYCIYQGKKRWFGTLWRRTHLCNTLDEAKGIIGYIQRRDKYLGEVVYKVGA